MSGHVPSVAELTPIELKDRLDRGEPLVVLDVREPDERAFAKIPLPTTVQDLHIPMGQVVGRLEEIRDASSSGHLVVYCHHGIRSMTAAVWLSRQGVGAIANLEGGIDAWSAIDPSVRRY